MQDIATLYGTEISQWMFTVLSINFHKENLLSSCHKFNITIGSGDGVSPTLLLLFGWPIRIEIF